MESYNEISEKTNATHNDPSSESTNTQPDQGQESIRVRCPECFKLYTVATAEIKVARPRFSCSKCQGQFWLSFPESFDKDEVVGFPLDWLESKTPSENKVQSDEVVGQTAVNSMAEPDQIAEKSQTTGADLDKKYPPYSEQGSVEPQKSHYKDAQQDDLQAEASKFPCPKCDSLYVGGDKECSSCGLIFEKYEALKDKQAEPPAILDLKTLWDEVIANYTNEVFHKTFINACQEQENLTYAANRYNTILEIHPSDDVSLKFRDQILALTLAQADSLMNRQYKEGGGLPKRGFKFTSLIMLLSGIVIAIGYFVPSLRNLMAFGASILFFTIAVRFYFKV